jgi:hypothetical protein
VGRKAEPLNGFAFLCALLTTGAGSTVFRALVFSRFRTLLFGTVYKNLWTCHYLGNFCLTVFGVLTNKVTEVVRSVELLRGRIMFGQIMFGQIRLAARHTVAAVVWKIRVRAWFCVRQGVEWLLQKESQGKNLLVLSGFAPTLFPVVTSKSNSGNWERSIVRRWD